MALFVMDKTEYIIKCEAPSYKATQFTNISPKDTSPTIYKELIEIL